MTLHGDFTFRRNSRQLSIIDHDLAVELDSQAVALHGYNEPVPLANGLIHFLEGGTGLSDFLG
jgi:hypothetical protein